MLIDRWKKIEKKKSLEMRRIERRTTSILKRYYTTILSRHPPVNMYCAR